MRLSSPRTHRQCRGAVLDDRRSLMLLLFVLVLLFMPSRATAQVQYNMNNSASLTLTLTLVDQFGNPLTATSLNNIHTESDVASGGHQHPLGPPGGAQFRLGRTNVTSCSTGWNGQQCIVTVTSGPAGGTIRIVGTIANGPQAGQTFTMLQPIFVGYNTGYDLDNKMQNFSGSFQLVGSTSTHPDNHWCRQDVCTRLVQLANDYNGAHGLTLAYNDSSLIKGGLFDVNANFRTPHARHTGGFDQDVRANGGPNSVPFDPAIRTWFENQVFLIFGAQPPWWHEEQGTPEEHYHIVG